MPETFDGSAIETRPSDEGVPRPVLPPLRVALLGTNIQPRWRRKIIAEVAASDDCQLILVIAGRPSTTPGRSGHPDSRRGPIGRLYRWADRLLFRRGPDALDLVDVGDLIGKLPALEVRFTDGGESIEEADVDRIRAYNPDVILCLGPEPRGRRVARLARFGVWAYRFGDAGASGVEPTGIGEVLGGRPSTTVSLNLIEAGPAGEERILYLATLKTHRLSACRHGDHLGGVASEFVGRELNRLRRGGSLAPRPGFVAPGGRSDGVTGDAETTRLIARFGIRLAAEGAHRALYQDQWVLAYSTRGSWDGHRPDLSTMRLLAPPPDRFWADPFPVIIDGVNYVYFEDYPYQTRKGHVSVFEVDDRGQAGRPRKALECDYHLSYPFVFSWGGGLYMIPETTAVGEVQLFRCSGAPDRWEFDRTLIRGVRAADVTLAEHDGRWWLFACIPAEGAHNDVEELHLFHSDSPLGPWRAHRGNPVKSDVGSARPAGHLYRRDGTWYRPAQDCTMGYGHSIVLNRVENWDLGRYEETPSGRIDPGWAPGVERTHTFNALGNLFVGDARVSRSRLFPGKKSGGLVR